MKSKPNWQKDLAVLRKSKNADIEIALGLLTTEERKKYYIGAFLLAERLRAGAKPAPPPDEPDRIV